MTETPWYDRPLTPAEATFALQRTRAILVDLQLEQTRLGVALGAVGLRSHGARADWLIDRWTPDQRLAWRMRWLGLGLVDPAPADRPAWHGIGLTAAPRRRRRRPKRPPIIPKDRQLEIALAVLDRQPVKTSKGKTR